MVYIQHDDGQIMTVSQGSLMLHPGKRKEIASVMEPSKAIGGRQALDLAEQTGVFQSDGGLTRKGEGYLNLFFIEGIGRGPLQQHQSAGLAMGEKGRQQPFRISINA